MSEFQYYEFRALDRSLSQREMRELRAISTRAEITPNKPGDLRSLYEPPSAAISCSPSHRRRLDPKGFHPTRAVALP